MDDPNADWSATNGKKVETSDESENKRVIYGIGKDTGSTRCIVEVDCRADERGGGDGAGSAPS